MALDTDFEIPWKFDKYVVQKHIGDGTYGFICEAIHEGSGDRVVAKIANPLKLEKGIQSINNEYVYLRLIEHPNIIRLLDRIMFSDTSGDNRRVLNVALILERCVCDLDDFRVFNPHLNRCQIRTITSHVFQALAYLEENMIIHCDVKPSNVLLSYDGRMKLCDFGSAKRIGGQSGGRVYTLGYAASEVLLQVETLDHKVDSWSAGCVFAELWKGDRLFEGSEENIHIRKMFQFCGCFTEERWTAFRHLLPETYREINSNFGLGNLNGRLQKFVRDSSARDLLCRLLATDREERWTCTQALESPYMQGPSMSDLKGLVATLEEELATMEEEDEDS